MKILAVNGSPRRDKGRTYQILAEILAGAENSGAECSILHLIDDHPQYCIHCGHSCFTELDCAQEESATIRSQMLDDADAIVIGAPVYVWQPSGLTAAFFDKLRLKTGHWRKERHNGKPALGVAVAGGTGSGVFTALQSIYSWFCLWKYSPMEPLPVTRFNFEAVVEAAGQMGKSIVESKSPGFEDAAELMLRYDRLRYMDYTRIDEFRWLAAQIVESSSPGKPEADTVGIMSGLLAEADELKEQGDYTAEAQRIVEAYKMGLDSWE